MARLELRTNALAINWGTSSSHSKRCLTNGIERGILRSPNLPEGEINRRSWHGEVRRSSSNRSVLGSRGRTEMLAACWHVVEIGMQRRLRLTLVPENYVAQLSRHLYWGLRGLTDSESFQRCGRYGNVWLASESALSFNIQELQRQFIHASFLSYSTKLILLREVVDGNVEGQSTLTLSCKE